MKLFISLLFLLVSTTYGARLSIDVFPSTHRLDVDGGVPATTNKDPVGCLIPHLGRCGTCNDASIKKQLKCVGQYDTDADDTVDTDRKWTFKDCDCPLGSSCKENDPLKNEPAPVCRVEGREVHMGATEYDFEALNMVLQDTQIRPHDGSAYSTALLAAFDTVVKDHNGNGDEQKNKYPMYSVRIEGVDPRAYASCSVTVTGTVAGAISVPLDVTTSDVYVSNAPKLNNPTGKDYAECLFRPFNEAVLGTVRVNISFVRLPVYLGPSDDVLQSVEMQIKFVPNPVDDAKWYTDGEDVSGGAIEYLFPDFTNSKRDSEEHNLDHGSTLTTDTGVFRFDSFGDGTNAGAGFDKSSSTALKGTLKLPVKGTFFDKRYKIVDESGSDTLLSGVGEGEMRKEGLEIHKDFDGFYDPSRDAFDNLGLNMNPVPFSDRIAKTKLLAALQDAAQYKMEHTYAMTFGGGYEGELAHFQPDYLACDICPARIVFKAFPSTGIHDTGVSGAVDETDFLLKYHVSIDPSELPTSSNVVSLNNIDVDIVDEASGHRTFNELSQGVSISRKMALRLPSDKDPQNADGYPLYQFMTPKISTLKKDYTSLLSPYNFSMSILDFEGNSASGNCKKYGSSDNCLASSNPSTKDACITEGCNWVADKGLVKSGGCKNGKLYEIGTNIFGAAEKVFKENCRIQLKDHAFGQNMNITFGDKTAYIRQVDLRSVYAGATELSILRRKADPSATLLGDTVSFRVSKYGHNSKIEFSVKGTDSMIGFASDGSKCTQAMVNNFNGLSADGQSSAQALEATHKGCSGLATAAELNITLLADSSDTGKSVLHSLRSSPTCFRYFDIELHDVSNPWAIYQLRLPCNRITKTEAENITLTYSFESSYDLYEDQFTAKIGYQTIKDQKLSIAADTSSLQLGFGTCAKNGGADSISRVNSCVDVSGGAQPVSGWNDGSVDGSAGIAATSGDAKGEFLLESGDKVDLEALRDCDTLGIDADYIDDEGAQYVMRHSLALMYTRSDQDGAGRTDIKYCQDQTFLTTIRRDATASVVVGTLVDKSLDRSVMVTSIDWIQCDKNRVECKQSDDCFKLRIEMDSKDNDKGANTWADSSLTAAEIGLGQTNTDGLVLDTPLLNITGGDSGYDNRFALESVCGVVDTCDATDKTTHYGSLVETETHFVISGFFENIISTSNVEVETKFEACPIQAQTNVTKDVLRLGMQIACVSAKDDTALPTDTSSLTACDASGATATCNWYGGGFISNKTTPSKRGGMHDCTQAEATAYARVHTEVAISKENAILDTIPDADFDKALANGWKIQNITYSINRYEALLDGSKDVTRQVSSTALLRFGRGNTSNPDYDELYECKKLASRLPGLSLFDENILDCDPSLTATANSKSITGSNDLDHDDVSSIYFDLLPLLDANLDVFEVQADALLYNSNIDASQNPTRRRLLRAITYKFDLPPLKADDEIVGKSNGFRVLQPSKSISDGALPSAPVDAPVSDSGKSDSTADGEADVDTVLIIVIVICVLAVAVVLLVVNKDKMCPAGSSGSSGGSAPASAEEGASLLVGSENRKTRFSNLRY